jgi:hypothetical protein
MDADHTSHELLAHFDRPSAPSSPASAITLPTRGVRWVLKWSAAIAVLVFASGVLTEFAYVAGAEHALAHAARAGLVEATLPRASYDSVKATIDRRLESYPDLSGQLSISLLQNSARVSRNLLPRDSDRLSIVLTADSDAALPTWLKTIRFWRSGPRLQVHAEREMPSRELKNVAQIH